MRLRPKLSASFPAGSIKTTLLRINSVGNQLTILALACKSAARSGIAIFTEAMPRGPIIEPRQTTNKAAVATGSLHKRGFNLIFDEITVKIIPHLTANYLLTIMT